MKRKKIMTSLLILWIIATTLFLSSCHTEKAPEASEPLSCQEYKTESWTVKDSPKQLPDGNLGRKNLLIHNDGNPIKTDLFVDGKSEGNYLVGVYYTSGGGMPEEYYFTSEPDGDKAELMKRVSKNQEALLRADLSENGALTDIDTVKIYNWEYKKDSTMLATLDTAVVLKRTSTNSNVNEKNGSIWDVTALTKMEAGESSKMNGYQTKLSVDQPGQTLLSYGPVNNISGETAYIGLNGVSYSFDIEGFSVEDLSSLADNYGKWNFYDGIGRLQSMETKPGISAANTSGDFVLELSHAPRLSASVLRKDTYKSGIIRISVKDR